MRVYKYGVHIEPSSWTLDPKRITSFLNTKYFNRRNFRGNFDGWNF